jgi:hypothetical protein
LPGTWNWSGLQTSPARFGRDIFKGRMHSISKEDGNLVRVEVSGTLTQKDYDELIPSWKQTIARHGKMRLLFVMKDFHGWEPSAAWKDLRFDLKHGENVERVAMVGEKKWQQWISNLGALFAKTEVRYFDESNLTDAECWVSDTEEGCGDTAGKNNRERTPSRCFGRSKALRRDVA